MTASLLYIRPADGPPLDITGPLTGATITTASTQTEALDVVTGSQVDCIVVAAEVGRDTALSVFRALHQERPDIPIVLCTQTADGELVSDLFQYGLAGYHIRERDDALAETIQEVIGSLDDTQQPILSDGASATHGTPFIQIAETVNDGIVTIDEENIIQFANDQLAELSGHNHSELVGKSLVELMPDRFREGHQKGIQRYLDTGERSINWDYIELAIQHKAGHEVPVSVSFNEFRRDGTQLFTGLIRDISGRKSHARALEELHEVTSDDSLSPMEKIERMIDDHRKRLGVSLGFLGRFEDGNEIFEVVAGEHHTLETGLELPLEQTYCQYAVEDDDPLVLEDATDGSVIPDNIYAQHGLTCYLGEPITIDGELYGTVCFADDRTTDAEFDDVDIAFLEILGDAVGYELAQKHQRERLRAEQERIENILERVDDAFFAVDSDWNFTYFNNRAEQLLGRDRGEVLGENVWELFGEAVDLDFYDQYHRAMETQQAVSFEEYFPPLDMWFEVRAYPSEDGLSVYFADVTERKEYIEALSALHEQTRKLVQAPTIEAVADTVVTAAQEVLGFELCSAHCVRNEQFTPVTVSAPAADRIGEYPSYPLDTWGMGEAYRTGEPVFIENPQEQAGKTPAGIPVEDVEHLSCVLFVPIGEYGVLSVGTADGTLSETDRSLVELLATNAEIACRRAQREQELRKNKTVLETVEGMVFATDESGTFELTTKRLAEWLGYDQETLETMSVAETLGEEDYQQLQTLATEIRSETYESQTLELTFVSAEGEPLPAEIELSVPADDSSVTGLIGVIRDLSALLEARQQLEAERDRFLYLVENLPDAVTEIRYEDTRPIIESVNAAFEDIFGYERHEVIGESINEAIVPVDEREQARTIDEQGADGTEWSGEVRRVTANGYREFLFRSVPYREPDGGRYGFGIYTDITERKQRDQRLQVLTRVLRHNLRNELSVLLGYAELLRDELTGVATEPGQETVSGSLVDAANALCDGINRVAELTEETRQVQKTLANASEGPGYEPVGETARRVCEAYRDRYPDAEFDITVPESITARADSRIELALTQLVENALEHGNDAPVVRIDAATEDETLLLTVADNGPRIPEFEWDLITGQTEITQLSHGSGLGLWAVKWVTESYGGLLERQESDLGGECIQLYLPGLLETDTS